MPTEQQLLWLRAPSPRRRIRRGRYQSTFQIAFSLQLLIKKELWWILPRERRAWSWGGLVQHTPSSVTAVADATGGKIIITPSIPCIQMSNSITATAFFQQLKCIIHRGFNKSVIMGTASFIIFLTTREESEDHFSSCFRPDAICVNATLHTERITLGNHREAEFWKYSPDLASVWRISSGWVQNNSEAACFGTAAFTKDAKAATPALGNVPLLPKVPFWSFSFQSCHRG